MEWRPWGRCCGVSLQGEALVFFFQINGTARIIKKSTGRERPLVSEKRQCSSKRRKGSGDPGLLVEM